MQPKDFRLQENRSLLLELMSVAFDGAGHSADEIDPCVGCWLPVSFGATNNQIRRIAAPESFLKQHNQILRSDSMVYQGSGRFLA